MMNNNQPKKVFTLEDNVRTIAFGVKDLVKELAKLNEILMASAGSTSHKSNDGNSLPF